MKDKWNIYTSKIENGKIVFSHVCQLVGHWPTTAFAKFAEKRGYPAIVGDSTLFGGYARNQEGECMFCVPAMLKVESIYG